MVHRRENVRRVVRRDICAAEAAAAIGPVVKGMEVFGLSKGKYSLVDMLIYVLDQIGEADVVCSTWTASGADIGFVFDLLRDRRIRSMRWLVDFSFQSRQPAFCSALVARFGAASLRICKSHAKFLLARNAEWDICIRSSMNMNRNLRLETWEISDDRALAEFLSGVVDELFEVQAPGEGLARRPAAAIEEFQGLFESGPVKGVEDAVKSTDVMSLERHFSNETYGVDLRRAGVSYARTKA